MTRADLEWVRVRATQRKDLVQITEANALDVIAAVGGAVYFERGGSRRLSVGGTSRAVGQWVDRGGNVWPSPLDEAAPFEVEHATAGSVSPEVAWVPEFVSDLRQSADKLMGEPEAHRLMREAANIIEQAFPGS